MISDDKYDFEYISRSALIDAKKISIRYNILITLEDNFCWMKIERGIEHWMLENKKQIIDKDSYAFKKEWKELTSRTDINSD